MRSVSSTSLKLLFVLSALLLLSGCNSELTGIDAPLAVEADQTFEVSVSQQFLADGGGDSPTDDLVEYTDGAFVLGVVIPSHMSAEHFANYQGTWDGVPMDFDLVLQAGIPETNLADYLENSDDPPAPETIDYLRISDCATVIEELDDEIGDDQLLFFQSTVDLEAGPGPQPGDGGEFSFQLTVDGTESGGSVAVIHGWLLGASISPGEDLPLVDVLGCGWYPDPEASDPEDGFIPDAEFAEFRAFPSDSKPVPVLSGAMIAILALLLAMAGILVGRRKSQHRD